MCLSLERLQALVTMLIRANNGGAKGLAGDMRAARYPISTRKLVALAEGIPEQSVKIKELIGLHNFAKGRGYRGLDWVFQTLPLLQAVAATGETAIYVASKPQSASATSGPQTDNSQWDTQSVSELLRGLYKDPNPSFLLKMKDCFLEEHDPLLASLAAQLEPRTWYGRLHANPVSTSVITIGSPKALHASEVAAATMFGVKPFGQEAEPVNLPFGFAYSAKLMQARPSTFAYVAEPQAPGFHPYDVSALKFGDRTFSDSRERDQWTDFGVILTQLRAEGQIWTVIAGNSGPATLAAARLAGNVIPDFGSRVDHEGNSAVYCRAVCAVIKRDPENSRGGDPRELIKQEFLGDPIVWERGANP